MTNLEADLVNGLEAIRNESPNNDRWVTMTFLWYYVYREIPTKEQLFSAHRALKSSVPNRETKSGKCRLYRFKSD